MNWPKITGYVGVTSSVISIVSQVASTIVPEQGYHNQIYDMLRWSSFLWAYAIFTMAVYLSKTLERPIHVVFGLATALLCLSLRAEWGYGVGIAYSFWAYAKLDQKPGNLPF
ncbi:hypothetical protein AXX12_15645 [Anaerosporomusa subterranea]|uniref:Uncharacterized protein n=1 Tax=Anaerosporomusa subterranea TaxID=1794912 RepID=A0A154BMD6_ANASB|nr:hypothetical protein [Anaerosporomusa subterranea]KYZ75010.1 hypothetical protein AXX12_15645 [Anaerosporomusa subterranea]